MPILETPNMFRGDLYNTHLYRRCPSFRPCSLCMRCRNYCQHLEQCVLCEARKTNIKQRLCDCTESQRMAKIRLEAHLKAPLFDVGRARQGSVNKVDTSKVQDWNELVDALQVKPQQE